MGWSLAHQTQMQRQIKDKTIHLHSGQYWDFQANMSFPHLNGHRSLRAAWDLHFSHFCLLLMISDFLHRSQRHFLLLNLFNWYEYFRFKRILIKSSSQLSAFLLSSSSSSCLWMIITLMMMMIDDDDNGRSGATWCSSLCSSPLLFTSLSWLRACHPVPVRIFRFTNKT